MALARVFGCVRVVFNDVIAARQEAHLTGAVFPTAGALSKRLITEAKKTPQRAWLAEVSTVPLQQAVRDADRAFRNFFSSLKGKRKGRRVGAPKFKTKRGKQSARFTANARFHVDETVHGVGHVRLQKIGRVRFALSRSLPSTPSSVTVIQEADGRYYVSFVVEEPAPKIMDASERVAGIDMGLIDLAAIVYSDGTREKIPNPRWLRTKERTLARAQRSFARKQKGSRNWDRARVRVAALHRKIRETRLDHHHKLAHRLVRENQTVALEGLSVAGLVRTRLARSIQDAAWSTLTRLIQEKATVHGREVRVVSQWEPTTQVCSVCGARDSKKPLDIRTWTCGTCSTTLDRDYNAAVNIMLAAGLAESLNACGPDARPQLAGAVRYEAGTHRTDRNPADA
ncbi:RNA-guided endonuclease InsQ/TnpB family protein [Kocuria rosea]|uniref:RNA-guided endonuclease InsQ/TnpB family protein n=1 Tax=Kocuria rosea TaxID=1275 RepID=UPI003D6D5C7E